MDLPTFDRLLPHIGYILMLIALAVRDMLRLRTILAGAQGCLLAYSLMQGNQAVAFWNGVFIVLNTIQVARILRERKPIGIPPSLKDLFDGTFSSMDPREFLLFWEMGEEKSGDGDVLVREGERQNELRLLLSGNVTVYKGENTVALLSRGHFMSEMSFISGEPASATVRADGPVSYIAWNREKLDSLDKINPSLFIKVQGILGRDLISKIRTTTSHLGCSTRG